MIPAVHGTIWLSPVGAQRLPAYPYHRGRRLVRLGGRLPSSERDRYLLGSTVSSAMLLHRRAIALGLLRQRLEYRRSALALRGSRTCSPPPMC